jgi:hypothetical protein
MPTETALTLTVFYDRLQEAKVLIASIKALKKELAKETLTPTERADSFHHLLLKEAN